MARAITLLLFWVVALGTAQAESREIVIASYNVENYLGPKQEGESPGAPTTRPKPESAVEAVVSIIKEINPDILGLCEMGRPEDFEEFKKRLTDAGLGYVDSEYVAGPDPERHLALLSRYPIASRQSLPDVSYELGGEPLKVRRGFLDVTVRVNDSYELRLLGAHLKSKVLIPAGQELQRRHEAQLLRRHAEQILKADSTVNLLLYGDFNDTKNEAAIQSIMGPRGSSQRLADLVLKDNAGDRWTHYWKVSDLYSRIDYFFASTALMPEIVLPRSGIYGAANWNLASDHRPIFTVITPVNRR